VTSPRPAADLIALDIGGANIKAADGLGWSRSEPFAMWREWGRLTEALGGFLASRPQRVVATMSGEIADCFASRAEGVGHIVQALAAAAARAGCRDVGFYRIDGQIVGAAKACDEHAAVAASNWHALARLAVSLAPTDRTWLVDVGSTTVDLIPLHDRRPSPLACDDAGRMASGELVYTGMERTPVPAIVRFLPHRGVRRPVASELFAQSRDAWLLLGGLAEDASARDTADGGPATREAARRRLARSLLLDPERFTMDDAVAAADWVAATQCRGVARAMLSLARGVGSPPTGLVISGHGQPLVGRAIARLGWKLDSVSVQASLGADVARVGPAHALALIARGELGA